MTDTPETRGLGRVLDHGADKEKFMHVLTRTDGSGRKIGGSCEYIVYEEGEFEGAYSMELRVASGAPEVELIIHRLVNTDDDGDHAYVRVGSVSIPEEMQTNTAVVMKYVNYINRQLTELVQRREAGDDPGDRLSQENLEITRFLSMTGDRLKLAALNEKVREQVAVAVEKGLVAEDGEYCVEVEDSLFLSVALPDLDGSALDAENGTLWCSSVTNITLYTSQENLSSMSIPFTIATGERAVEGFEEDGGWKTEHATLNVFRDVFYVDSESGQRCIIFTQGVAEILEEVLRLIEIDIEIAEQD